MSLANTLRHFWRWSTEHALRAFALLVPESWRFRGRAHPPPQKAGGAEGLQGANTKDPRWGVLVGGGGGAEKKLGRAGKNWSSPPATQEPLMAKGLQKLPKCPLKGQSWWNPDQNASVSWPAGGRARPGRGPEDRLPVSIPSSLYIKKRCLQISALSRSHTFFASEMRCQKENFDQALISRDCFNLEGVQADCNGPRSGFTPAKAHGQKTWTCPTLESKEAALCPGGTKWADKDEKGRRLMLFLFKPSPGHSVSGFVSPINIRKVQGSKTTDHSVESAGPGLSSSNPSSVASTPASGAVTLHLHFHNGWDKALPPWALFMVNMKSQMLTEVLHTRAQGSTALVTITGPANGLAG